MLAQLFRQGWRKRQTNLTVMRAGNRPQPSNRARTAKIPVNGKQLLFKEYLLE